MSTCSSWLSPSWTTTAQPRISNDKAVAVATRMAAEVTRICSAHTAAGTIWEVDAALRPEGRAGQLVRTLASHRIYYERWAKTWEFQAMLKARPSAGDLTLGQDFVDMISPMVWQAAERDNFVSDAQAMRKRVVAHIPSRDAGSGAQARRRRAARRRVLRPAAAARPRAGRRAAPAAADPAGSEGPGRQRLRRPRGRPQLRPVLPLPADPGAPDPAVQPAPYPRAPRQRARPAPARSLDGLLRPGRRAADHLAAHAPSGYGDCTNGSSTPRCSTPSPGSRATSCG